METGCTSTLGFFHELSEARRAVIGNMGDTYETSYDYAVIEEMRLGFTQTVQIVGFQIQLKKDEQEAVILFKDSCFFFVSAVLKEPSAILSGHY